VGVVVAEKTKRFGASPSLDISYNKTQASVCF
jgi:hypothetical protein